jgi:cysteine desulfurase
MQTAYMDHAAATPVRKEVSEAMAPYFDRLYGNPSAVYDLGSRCKQVLEAQRANVAGLIGH